MAKKPFVVLDAEILSSSVWSEAAHVRLVWITLLVLCDTDGGVGASIPGIASAAGVTLEEAEDAIRKLQEPDPYSRTKLMEGRRLEAVERGFRILNFHDHLDRLSAERAKARDRMRRFREKRNRDVTETPGYVTIPTGNREQGEGKKENVSGHHPSVVGEGGVGGEAQRLPANPLIAGRRPQLETEGYRLVREIAEIKPDEDPTEILLQAARWESRDGRARTKCRLETMTDDHLIRTVHDLRSTLSSLREAKDPKRVQTRQEFEVQEAIKRTAERDERKKRWEEAHGPER